MYGLIVQSGKTKQLSVAEQLYIQTDAVESGLASNKHSAHMPGLMHQ